VTCGPHETQRKVSRAALKKVKKLLLNFQLKLKVIEKIGKLPIFLKTAEFLDVRGLHWTLSGAACL